jgi:hypothetical protein
LKRTYMTSYTSSLAAHTNVPLNIVDQTKQEFL